MNFVICFGRTESSRGNGVSSQMRLLKIPGYIFIVMSSILVLLVILEFALRVSSGLFFAKMMVLDDRLGWGHAKNVSKTFKNEDLDYVPVTQNANGHRGKYYGPVKSIGKYRILALGDSFTEGVQVKEEELLSARLEKMDPDVEALNAGVGGYGTVQEYLYLIRDGLTLRPDLVLLMFYENDLSDNCLSYYPGFGPRPYAILRNDEIQIIERLDYQEFRKFIIPVPLWTFLNRHSYLYYFVNVNIYQQIFTNRMRKLQELDLEKTRGCGRYEIFYKIVQRTKDLLSTKGIEFAVVLIPTREDVERGKSPTLEPILKFCREQSLSCLSLLNRFVRERTTGSRLYFTSDIHWTKTGHAIAADEINRLVRALKRSRPGTAVPGRAEASNVISSHAGLD
jgi:lysophospholipase L1-like esterase